MKFSFEKYNYNYFKKLFLIFIIGAILGLFIEETFLFFRGIIYNFDRINWNFDRSLIYGPFSPVYGIGAVVLTVFFADRKLSWWKVFLLASFLAGATEFIASFVQEHLLGTVSWDYTGEFLNILGRTKVTYMLGFGLVGLFFIYGFYPIFNKFYNLFNQQAKNIIYYSLLLFMCFNVFISVSAVNRYYERQENIEPSSSFENFLDRNYSDEDIKMHVYKMKIRD